MEMGCKTQKMLSMDLAYSDRKQRLIAIWGFHDQQKMSIVRMGFEKLRGYTIRWGVGQEQMGIF